MAEFGATADVTLEIPRREIERAQQEIEQGIGDVNIEPDVGSVDAGGGGGTQAVDLLAEQVELLDDIRDEILADEGGLIGGGGGGATGIIGGGGLLGGAAGGIGTAASLLGGAAVGTAGGLAGVKGLEEAGINDAIEGLGEDLSDAIPNNEELAGALSLGSEAASIASPLPDFVGGGAAARDLVTGSGGARQAELETLEQEFIDSLPGFNDVTINDIVPAIEPSIGDIVDPLDPGVNDIVPVIEADVGDVVDIGRLDDPAELLEPNIDQLDDLGSVLGPKIPQVQNPQDLIDIASIDNPASLFDDVLSGASANVSLALDDSIEIGQEAIDNLADTVSVSVDLSPNFDIDGLSGRELENKIDNRIDRIRDDLVDEVVRKVKDKFSGVLG